MKWCRVKLLSWVLAVFCALELAAGCASLPKKFIRKKKQPTYIPSVIPLDQGAYQKKYSNDYYYKMHFTYWRGWHDDLLNQWGDNRKKVLRAAQESLGQLAEMARYLKPERQAALQAIVNDMTGIVRQIEDGRIASHEDAMRNELEKIQRLINSGFYYDKVKDDLLADTVDLGQPSSAAGAPAS